MGHGHVTPNPDGSKARCGGPVMCSKCAQELAQLQRIQATGQKMAEVIEEAHQAEPLSPEVWEAQQQELARLARLVEQLERMNQELRFAGEARAKQDREAYTIADVLTSDKDALLKLATDENEALRARVRELEEKTAWRTIDSAPLFDAEGEERVIVCGGRHKKPVIITPDGEWWRIEAARGSKAVPTHWMPMPDAPESLHNAPSLPQEPPVPVSAGDSSSEYAGMPWEGRP